MTTPKKVPLIEVLSIGIDHAEQIQILTKEKGQADAYRKLISGQSLAPLGWVASKTLNRHGDRVWLIKWRSQLFWLPLPEPVNTMRKALDHKHAHKTEQLFIS